MIEYENINYSELSVARITDGRIYHLMGSYCLKDGNRVVFPVNRSYCSDVSGDRLSGEVGICRKDKLIHEKVNPNAPLKDAELLVEIYNKPLLFVENTSGITWYSLNCDSNQVISPVSMEMVDKIREGLLRAGFAYDYRIGVYGSHQVGLNGVDSDIDLIAWVDCELRSEFLRGISEIFHQVGCRSSEEIGKDAEYAVRYANRLKVPLSAGFYLASKRIRWINPNGVSFSLQCLNLHYNHEFARRFIEGINEPWKSKEITCLCRVVSADNSYNFPKIWQLEIDGHQLRAISFSWTHQGMGDDDGEFRGEYLFKGAKITCQYGEFLFLRGEDHYLLPQKLL